jgi:hypothetical protein
LDTLPEPSAVNVMPDSPKFLLDENIPKSVKKLLESKGFTAENVPKGIADSNAADLAKERKAAILSRDSDFLNRALFPPSQFFGIIIFVIHPPRPEKLATALSLLLAKVKKFKGKLLIVGESGYEIVE